MVYIRGFMIMTLNINHKKFVILDLMVQLKGPKSQLFKTEIRLKNH